jgi:hypothetical protein
MTCRHPRDWHTRDYDDPAKPLICGKCRQPVEHTPTPRHPASLTRADRGIPCDMCSLQLRAVGAHRGGLVIWEHVAQSRESGRDPEQST